MGHQQSITPLRLTRGRQRGAGYTLNGSPVARGDLPIVYVGRPSPWGNRFATARQFYKSLTPARMARIKTDLAGKHLACWCKAGAECHGDILIAVANDRPLPLWATIPLDKKQYQKDYRAVPANKSRAKKQKRLWVDINLPWSRLYGVLYNLRPENKIKKKIYNKGYRDNPKNKKRISDGIKRFRCKTKTLRLGDFKIVYEKKEQWRLYRLTKIEAMSLSRKSRVWWRYISIEVFVSQKQAIEHIKSLAVIPLVRR